MIAIVKVTFSNDQITSLHSTLLAHPGLLSYFPSDGSFISLRANSSCLNSIADIYLLVKFLCCLFFCFFHVYLLPVMVNKCVYIIHLRLLPPASPLRFSDKQSIAVIRCTQRSVTHDSLRYINILTYLLTYLYTYPYPDF